MTTTRWLFSMVALIGAAALTGADDRPLLRAENFAKLQALIKPQPEEEKWLQIPWSASLSAARKRAAAEGKPILLWEMDGHPLGCT
jgi:hypothetical protein